MENIDLLSDHSLDRIFRKLDIISEKIHQYAIEPLLSGDIERRTGGKGPSFNLTDDYIMHFIEKQRFPVNVDSNNRTLFWESFDNTRYYLGDIGFPFFAEFTSLCHLLSDLGFDCAKPDSIVMGVAERLGIIGNAVRKGQRPLRERKKVVDSMQIFPEVPRHYERFLRAA
jgi:hypothetical protein